MGTSANTTSGVCRTVASLLVKSGVKVAVCCPGTRNVPLLMAFNRVSGLKTVSVIDERSAAFIALGIAQASGKCVALCCTSGTAVLNFAPAVAEAYYKNIPLFVVSADRPEEWIGQLDSQTIVQPGVFKNIIRAEADLSDSKSGWYINREINRLLLAASEPGKNGPVHLNVRLTEPLETEVKVEDVAPRLIRRITSPSIFPTPEARSFVSDVIKNAKLMVVLGYMPPSNKLSRALKKLSRRSNVVILAEPVANIMDCDSVITNPDTVIASLHDDEEDFRPDYILYAGGALVSRNLKEYLRRLSVPSFRIGRDDVLPDTFCNLAGIFEFEPVNFFSAFASAMIPESEGSSYKRIWHERCNLCNTKISDFMTKAPWCDFSALWTILSATPESYNIQLSNGMSVRYAFTGKMKSFHRVDSNRGVSGIDGSTSVALGATMFSDRITLFIAGDMSAQYDMAALFSSHLNPRLKMVVLGNGNGGIFHIIRSTRNVAELSTLISPQVNFPAAKLSDALDMAFFHASSFDELENTIPEFFAEKDKAAMLYIATDSADSAQSYRNFFRTLKI